MRNLLVLLDAIHIPLNRPEYVPLNGVTHCNSYVNDVCQIYGYKELDAKLANEICNILAQDPQWSEVPMEQCQDLANTGTLIVAGLKADTHGHVNVISPGRVKTSGRWGNVPSCANVGKEIFIGKGINWAFSDLPKFWAWRPSL